MLGIPSETPYDLRFRLLGIPVRVHPLFWVIMLILGWNGGDATAAVVFVCCAFVSILIHEYGHGLMARLFGCRPYIILYGMGGLCASEGERQTPWQRLAVLLSGPGAGLFLAGLVFLSVLGMQYGHYRPSPIGAEVVNSLLFINVVWSILNLFPIWPLDGGQIAGVVLSMINRRDGMRWAHVVSLLTSGVMALVSYQFFGSLFMAIFFAFFAMRNFQILQIMHQYAKHGSFDDDEDWWRR